MLNFPLLPILAAIGPGGAESRAHDVPGVAGPALKISLNFIDYSILGVYLIAVIGIGFALKRYTRSAEDYLLSGRSIRT